MHNPAAMKLCEATLFGPAATGERTDAFVAKHKLPAAKRYDGRAQLKTYERLVRDGLARLPSPQDPPYLWFHETMRGQIASATPASSVGSAVPAATIDCELSLTISIASMYQLAQERRADVRGEAFCTALHDKALTVEDGSFWVRPDDGTPKHHGPLHPLLRYRLQLRDQDGQVWWLAGQKTAAPRRDLLRQARTLAVEIGREGAARRISPASWSCPATRTSRNRSTASRSTRGCPRRSSARPSCCGWPGSARRSAPA
jgi:hypothetical protein